MKQIRSHLTYANVMSTIAVFLLLSGATALAAQQLGKKTVGTKQLKTNAVTTAKIKKEAVTGGKLKKGGITGDKLASSAITSDKIADSAVTNGKLANGAVTSGKLAAGAVGAGQLGGNSVGNSQTQLVKVFKGEVVPPGPNEETAPRVELGQVGPFKFYGKCFLSGEFVEERTYIELTSGEATVASEDGADFDSNTTGYLKPDTPESKRALENDAAAKANEIDAESDDEEFQATASDGTQITGLVGGSGAKQGNPPIGNGPFLAEDSCIVGAIAVFGS